MWTHIQEFQLSHEGVSEVSERAHELREWAKRASKQASIAKRSTAEQICGVSSASTLTQRATQWPDENAIVSDWKQGDRQTKVFKKTLVYDALKWNLSKRNLPRGRRYHSLYYFCLGQCLCLFFVPKRVKLHVEIDLLLSNDKNAKRLKEIQFWWG